MYVPNLLNQTFVRECWTECLVHTVVHMHLIGKIGYFGNLLCNRDVNILIFLLPLPSLSSWCAVRVEVWVTVNKLMALLLSAQSWQRLQRTLIQLLDAIVQASITCNTTTLLSGIHVQWESVQTLSQWTWFLETRLAMQTVCMHM